MRALAGAAAAVAQAAGGVTGSGALAATAMAAAAAAAAKRAAAEYAGFRFTPDDRAVSRLPLAGLDPADFFARFVAARRPCVLVGVLPGARLDRWLDDAHLAAAAGDATVEIEHRATGGGPAFGRGRKGQMLFGEFVRALAGGEAGIYLTTQELALVRLHPHMAARDDIPAGQPADCCSQLR